MKTRGIVLATFFCLLSGFTNGADLAQHCEYSAPVGSVVRPGKLIRLGGYFYAGTMDVAWYGSNFDLVDLNAKNDPNLITRLKRINPSILVFQQFLTNQIAIIQTGAQAVEGYNLSIMSSWLMRTTAGTPAHPRGPYYLMMDPDSDWSIHFSRSVDKTLRETSADGVVLDEVPLRANGFFSNLAKYATDESLQAATTNFLKTIRQKLKRPVLINAGGLAAKSVSGDILWNTVGNEIDGAWHEGWIRYYGNHNQPHQGLDWEWDILSAERFSAAGKPYIASAAFANATELEYAISNYLLAIKSASLVFQPMVAYDAKTRGGFNFELAKNAVINNKNLFDIQIGCALGGREKSNGLWIRKYSQGLVLVNPSSTPKSFTISKLKYSDVNGNTIAGAIFINPFEGKILIENQ
jgi:hypothetical protein